MKIKDWGIEWEIPNIPLLSYKDILRDNNFTRGDIEKTVINNINEDYFYNDIKGQTFDYGSELNSLPQSNWKVIYENMKNIDNNQDITRDFLRRYRNFPKYKLFSFYDNTMYKLWYNLNRSNNWKDFEDQYFLSTSSSKSDYSDKQTAMLKVRYIRPYINLQQILHTNTVEFRCFNVTKVEDVENCFKWIEELISSYNENKKFNYKIFNDTILEKRVDLNKVLSFKDWWEKRSQ